MALCIRAGTRYKRHNFRSGTCRGCGAKKQKQLRSAENRQARRKAARHAAHDSGAR
jgi:hypothetical protein